MAERNLQQSIKCPICLETFQELKTLNCQHSFCLCCLQDWLKKNGELDCPNCRQKHPISDGGLQELPSNVVKEETQKNLNKDFDIIKCCCGKYDADVYCQDCCQYLCTFCTDTHEKFPALKNHTLQPASSWLVGPETLHQPLCPLHEQTLELYCNICKAPICQRCVVEHSEDEGLHEVTTVSNAFNDFKLSADMLMVQADIYKQQVQFGMNKCISNASKLSKSKVCLKKDINNTVEEVVKLVRETGKELETTLDDVCEAKKEKSNSQIDELKSIISDVEEKQDNLMKLLKSNKATALQTCQQATKELKQNISEVLPEGELNDGTVHFTSNKDHILSALKQHGVGSVSGKANEHDFVVSEYPKKVTRYKCFHVKISQRFKCEIDMDDMQATWNMYKTGYGGGEYIYNTVTAKVEQQIAEGWYLVAGPTLGSNLGNISRLDLNIQFSNAQIRGSPIRIEVDCDDRTISNLFSSIGIHNEGITDIFMSQNGYFLVVGTTNMIYKFKSTGEYISKIALSQGSCVSGIYQLKNNNLVVCDRRNRKIIFFTQDGQLIKSISTGESCCPSGIAVNEKVNLVYVADSNNCVEVFNMESNSKVKTIGSKGALEGQMNGPSCVALTKEGNIIVADALIPRIQLFDHEGQFMNLLIGGGSNSGIGINPSSIIVDHDDNIIVASESKIQLFDKFGKFIGVIYNATQSNHCVMSIDSHSPRRLATAEVSTSVVRVFSY